MANAISGNLVLPAEVSDEVIKQTLDASGLQNLSQVNYVDSGRDAYVVQLVGTDAEWVADGADTKVTGGSDMASITVPMHDLVKKLEYPEWQVSDLATAIDSLKTDLPKVLGNTIQKSVFGTAAVAGSPFDGFGAVTSIDTTNADAIGALADTVTDFTGWIVSKKIRADINKAFTNVSTSNTLREAVVDGSMVHGEPLYFASLDSDPTALAGVVGNFAKSVLVMDTNSVKIRVITGDTDADLAVRRQVRIVASMRVGFGIANDGSFKAFSKKAA